MSGYIKHGFLADVYEPWVEFEGSEWGEQMRPLVEAYKMGEDYGLGELIEQLETIIRTNLNDSAQFLVDYYSEEFEAAVARYPETQYYWQSRAKEFKREKEFTQTERLVPKWMKPSYWTKGIGADIAEAIKIIERQP